MNWKLLFPLFAGIMRKRSSITDAALISRAVFKEALHEEIMSLSIRIMFGLILTSLVILSLVMVGQQANLLLLTLPDGPVLSLVIFGVLAVVAGGGLIYLFRGKPEVEERKPENNLDMPKVAGNFYQGLIEGLESSRRRRPHRAYLAPRPSYTDPAEAPTILHARSAQTDPYTNFGGQLPIG